MSSELDYWRQFLQTANYDIFKTIEHAIHVAATDYPDQFEKKNEHLMHIISTALSNKVLQSIASEHKYHAQLNDKKDKGKQVEIVNAESWTSEDDDDDENVGIRDCLNKKSERKQRKRKGKHVVTDNRITKNTSWRGREVHTETGSGSSMHNVISTTTTVKNGSAANLVAKEVEMVVEVESDVLTKENDVLGDVSKIRDALLQLKGQPVIAYELLMRLEKMHISAHVLQVTEIAAIVSCFANNDYSDSTQTRLLASSLLESWRIILDEWIEHANNARDTDKITVVTDIVEPKSSIEAAKRTGPIQFIKGSSRPQCSQPIFDIGSRGSANARCVVAGQQAERYKNRQLASSSQVQIGGSSRVNNYTTLKGQPKAGLQGPKLIAMEVPAPTKKIEEDPVRESLKIARIKLQEMLQKHKPDSKFTVPCQPDETHHIKNKQLTSGSQVQIGGSSRANNYTSIKSQPRSGLQGPKLTVKDTLNAKNKMEVPAPIQKIEECPVQESMKLAKRKFQEMQKSEQAKRHNMGLQSVNLAKRYNFVQRMPLPVPPQTYVRTLNGAAYGSLVQWPKEGIILADELTRPEKTVSPVRTTIAATTCARRPFVSDDTLDQLGTDFRTLHDHIMSEQELRSNYNIYINPGLLAHDGAHIFLGFSDIKDLMTWRWLTESIIQVWILYLITLSERDGISVGFMDPSKINQVALGKNNDDAVSYMANAMITFMDRKFILAPYYQNKHWVLLVIQPRDCMVYVLDTKIPEEGTKYVITRPFQTAIQSYVKLGGEHNGRKGEKVAWKFAKCALSRRALPMTDLHQIRLQWVKFLLGKIDK
ncbi:mediator of RNA polymerase II transcription subunit 26b [Carex littledalei]|uniref:Mediator of RNA polymerase II transcription subunit 26b n=1 Tax=Carex littledalei TaxID=544730 RepID=A0A833RF99_9POAL|nr:mediator of RNA polymerase II transcription subunit 26b [Carex littledalei]